MLLRERNLSSSETQKKRFDIINCEFHESYISILLRKQEVLSTAMSKCANVSANARTLIMNAIFMTLSMIFFITECLRRIKQIKNIIIYAKQSSMKRIN